MSELVTYTPPSTAELEQTWQLASKLARTEFVPLGLRGKPEAVLACILTGREVGVGPMQSLKHIPVIEGSPGMSAELMAALIRRAGHKLRIISRASDEAEVEGVRADDPDYPLRIRWTLQDAVRAKLCTLDKDGRPVRRDKQGRPMPWELYPDALLLARAISALGRAMFADVLAGVGYTPEELLSRDGTATEATWGEPVADPETGEVYEQANPGRVGGDPAAAHPAGSGAARMRAAQAEATETRQRADAITIPTLEQIQAIEYKGEVYKLIGNALASFREHIKRAVREMHDREASDFQDDATVDDWKQVLEYALELHEQQAHETSAVGVPPPAADPQSEEAGRKGKADQASSDPTLLEGGEVDG